MKNFIKNFHLFSLCGLNCGLCPMHLDNYCPGCGGGAVNLLELQDIKSVVEQIVTKTKSDNLTLKEKSALAINLFQSIAVKQNIVLKLNKKTNKK